MLNDAYLAIFSSAPGSADVRTCHSFQSTTRIQISTDYSWITELIRVTQAGIDDLVAAILAYSNDNNRNQALDNRVDKLVKRCWDHDINPSTLIVQSHNPTTHSSVSLVLQLAAAKLFEKHLEALKDCSLALYNKSQTQSKQIDDLVQKLETMKAHHRSQFLELSKRVGWLEAKDALRSGDLSAEERARVSSYPGCALNLDAK